MRTIFASQLWTLALGWTFSTSPYRRPCILAWSWIIFSFEGVRGAADRPALGHRRPLSSLGRRTHFRTEPEQLPGPTKPASGKDGPTVHREVLMEQHGIQHDIYEGIDVAKARVDVVIRPGGDTREVSNDPAGIAALVAQMQQLNPVALVMEASGGLELPLVVALAAASLPVVVVNPRQVAGLCQGHWAAGQDRFPGCGSPGSLRRGRPSSPASPPGRRDPDPQFAGGPQTTGGDHAGSGEEPPLQCRYGRPAQHRGPHRLAQAGAGRPGPRLAPDSPPESGMEGEGRPAA